MNKRCQAGFTLVEAVIVVIILAVILAVLIPGLRERERQRLQALANAEPWEVFEFRAVPIKETWTEEEKLKVHCEVINPTPFHLQLPNDTASFYLVFGDTDYYSTSSYATAIISGRTLAPGQSADLEVVFMPIASGSTDVRIAYANPAFGWQRVPGKSAKYTIENGNRIRGGFSPDKSNRFVSNVLTLVVKESESPQSQTFDEIISELELFE